MFNSWLDTWDEQRAKRGDQHKALSNFSLGGEQAFPEVGNVSSVAGFCDLAERAIGKPGFFDSGILEVEENDFEILDEWVRFPSHINSDVEENNTVWARLTDGGSRKHALVVFHHWNAGKRNKMLAKLLSHSGITVVEMAMPYHLERSRNGSLHADYMLGPNLGRTIQSMRQAVIDGRQLIRWLKHVGYDEVSVLGMSLGSWVAGLVAAHETTVSKASLLLFGGSFADFVWTGRATKLVRSAVECELDQTELNRAWASLNLENYAERLTRPDFDLQLIMARRDTVVLPRISESLVKRLTESGAAPEVFRLNCGHYSMTLPPYILKSGWKIREFLRRDRGREKRNQIDLVLPGRD